MLATLTAIPAAEAGPALYATSFLVDNSQTQCLQNSRQALLRLALRDEDIRAVSATEKSGKDIQIGWRADHPSENVSVLFECDARNGMGALAVAGGNNDATYSFYSRLWDLWMK